MPNSRHSEAIVSPSCSRITNRIRSSITERSFHGITSPPPSGPKSVTYVSGTFCYLCLGTDIKHLQLCPGIEGLQKGLHCRRHWRRGHKLSPNAGGSHAHCFNSLFPPRLVVDILSHVNVGVSHVVPRHLRPNASTAHQA